MSDAMKKELSININTNVNTEPIKKARNEIEAFRQECEGNSIKLGIDKKSLQVDTRGFYKAINAAKALEDQLRDIQKTAPKMMGAFEDSDSGFGFANKFREELKDAMIAFDDGSIVNGFDNIVSKISEGFKVVAVDLGNRSEYLRKLISDSLSDLDDLGLDRYYDGAFNFRSGTNDKNDILKRIKLVETLFEYQKELEKLQGREFSEEDSPLKWQTSSGPGIIEDLQNDYDELVKYNLLTMEQLNKRRDLIRDAYDNYKWDSSKQDSAKENIADEEHYNKSISKIKEYIEQRQNAIKALQENEHTLFSVDGISEYVGYANKEIKRLQDCMTELQGLRNAKDNTPDTPIIGNFSGVISQLEEIKNAINGIRDAFEPLTTALSSEDSALSAMVKSNITDLDLLNSKVNEAFANIEKLSNKQFNITNVLSGGNNSQNDIEQIRQFRQEAKEAYKQVEELYNEHKITANKIKNTPGGTDQILNFANLMADFDLTDTESLEEAEKKQKEIAKATAKRFKDANKSNVKDAVRLGGVTQEDFERYANEVAETKGLKVGQISVDMDAQGKMMTASVQMLNEELAQSITYTYRLMELEEGVAEAYLVGYKAKGDQNKALKQEAAAKKKEDAERLKADKERAKNNQWLIKQQGKLDTQERKYKYSNKSIDGTSSLMSDETSLADDVDKTIDNLTQHIRERIKSAMGGALTDELKEEISNDLRILQNEIAVQQNEKYSATNMKASTVKKNKDAYTEYLNAFEANAKKANVFDQMKESIASLRTELGNVTDSASMDKFIDNLKVARNKFQAEKAKYAQTSQEDKDQQQIYQNAIEAQEKLYNLKKQMVGVDPESSKGLELTRKLTDAQNEYNDALSQTNRQKLSIGQIQNIEDLEKQQKSELNEKRKEHVKKTAAQQEISDTEYLLSLYNDYTAAALKIKKMQSDTTGKSHKNEMATEIKNLQDAKRALMDLGIDVNNISGSELLTESEINALLEERVKYKKELQQIEDAAADKTETKANKEAQKYGKTIFNRESRYFDSINASVSSLGDVSFNPKFLESLEKYKTAYKELSDLRERFVNDPNAVNDDVLKNQFQESALNVSNLRKELNLLLNDHQKMANIPEESILGSMDIDIDKIGDARLAMIEFANTVTDGQFKFKGFNAAGTEMYGSISKGSNALEEITVSLSNVTNKMTAFTSGTKQVSSAWGKFGSEFKGEVKQLIGQYFGFYELFQAFRNGIGYVKEIDLAMTELKKVTNETDLTYENFLKDSSKTAANIGSTISDFTDATAAFARLGHTMEESASMAETAIVYKNVADGLDTVEEATDSIISTMMAFGIEASDTMSIVDKFNAVGNSFAITSAGIGDALQRSASALYTAGNTIDESVALVTAANSVIQNPEQVGTALKTLALRLRGAKVELEEAGLETENMAESTSQLQGKLLALTHGKVDIMKDAETFKNTTQILREMSDAWEDMTDIERAEWCPYVQKCA